MRPDNHDRFHDDEHTEFVYYAVNNDAYGSLDHRCDDDNCDRVHVHVFTDDQLAAHNNDVIAAASNDNIEYVYARYPASVPPFCADDS